MVEKISTVEKLSIYLDEIEKHDKRNNEINAFLYLNPHAKKYAEEVDKKIKQKKAGKLAGQIISIKSNICVENLPASCASKTLENYKAPYNAEVIQKLLDEDAVIIGMTNMDEFAAGSSGETSAFGPTKNPKNLELIPGGTSSGGAASVAANFCDIAIGSDTGGSIRNPASHCGLVGLKPTYSLVSRYGLIDSAMSTDTIGPLAKNVTDTAMILKIISGKDCKDAICQKDIKINLKEIEKIPKNVTIGILDFKIPDINIERLLDEKIQKMQEEYGWKTKKITIDKIDLAIEAYYPIIYVENFSTTRKLDGRRFGKKIEESCGPEFLRRILGGEEISLAEHEGRYYNQAQNVRQIIEDEFKSAFRKCDFIICPTVPRLPHKIGGEISIEEMYAYDVLTVPFSLARIPAISIPMGKIKDIPVGMQIACGQFEDQKMLQIARSIEKLDK
ncbi:aspartyl/glutamyl-tRNA amidotransferase subunit A [Candidatus Pacearchaeota archaeon]|nr:aspartyl/glutamyl-tRNA amidotransferase subunit A [Candidatus Pacearchaeota archaeon]